MTELVPVSDLDAAALRTALGPTWADYSQVVDDDDDEDAAAAKLEAAAVYVAQVYDSSRWWIADLLLFGEVLLGNRFYQLADALGIRPATMVEWRRVAERVPRSRRRQTLRFSHHRAIAALEPDAQTYWLNIAEERSLAVQDLEDELRKAREIEAGGDGSPPGVEATVVPSRVVEVARLVISNARRFRPDDGVAAWIVEDEIMAQLRGALGADE